MFAFAPTATVGALVVAAMSSGGVVLTVDATTPFTIAGTGGAGHGRGMGQWGAYAYAKQGWSADQILGHYYEGAQLGRVGTSVLGVRLMERGPFGRHGGRSPRPNERAHPPQLGALVVVPEDLIGRPLLCVAVTTQLTRVRSHGPRTVPAIVRTGWWRRRSARRRRN